MWSKLLNITTTQNDRAQRNLEGPIIGAFVSLKAICYFSLSGYMTGRRVTQTYGRSAESAHGVE